MHDFQSDVRLLIDDSLPRSLHQHIADHLLLAQMVNQNDGSERGDRQEMYVKQPESHVTHRFHMMRKIRDRKSTRLNSSHSQISYAVFCLKKKKDNIIQLKVVAVVDI